VNNAGQRSLDVIVVGAGFAGLYVRGLVGVAHYTAAKHGVVGLMRSLANELAPHNIRVNCVHPTNVDTPMTGRPRVPSSPRQLAA
jgi:NAD(P)-dependent dehydrogenase (short-subunit alcohol dehydrogenase family)